MLALALPGAAVAAAPSASAAQYVGGGGGGETQQVQGQQESAPVEAESVQTPPGEAIAPAQARPAPRGVQAPTIAARASEPAGGQSLPFTGADTRVLGLFGVALLVAGLGLAAATRPGPRRAGAR